MGQARKRGTFEQRKAESIEAARIETERKEQERLKRKAEHEQWKLDHPVEARKQRKRLSSAGLIMAAALGMSMPSMAFHTSEDEES